MRTKVVAATITVIGAGISVYGYTGGSIPPVIVQVVGIVVTTLGLVACAVSVSSP
jgi:hypothetical protein